MANEITKNKICIKEQVTSKTEVLTVEREFIVNDVKPDVLKIINTNGVVCVHNQEALEGKVRFDGSINTYIVYVADDELNNVRTLSTNIDFTEIINVDKCKTGMNVEATIRIQRIESKILNSRKLLIKVYLTISTIVCTNNEIEVLSDIEDRSLPVLKNQRQIKTLMGEGETKIYAKDTINLEAGDELAEIMYSEIKIKNVEARTSYNKVLVKADTMVNIMYLTEDERIKNVTVQIPIMGFIDIENINDNNSCKLAYTISNISLNPSTQEIYVEVETIFKCSVHEDRNIDIIEDLYSLTSNISFNKRNVKLMTNNENVKEAYEIRKQIEIPELSNGKIYYVYTNPVINTTKMQKGIIEYLGEVKLDILYEINNTLESVAVSMPFEFAIKNEKVNSNSKVETEIEIVNDNFVVSNGKIDGSLELEFNVNISNFENINLLDEISINETSQEDNYSMVIYFVKPGDTLWEIAKNFKTTIDDIVRINNIEDKNKIDIGEQLYIPKYVSRNISA